jgi:hypothetical protein
VDARAERETLEREWGEEMSRLVNPICSVIYDVWDRFSSSTIFFRITQYNENAHNTHAHSHPINTRTQTLSLWAPPKDWAPADLKIPEVTTGASSSTGTSLTT